MPIAELYLIKRCAEQIGRNRIKEVPRNIRGIYVLYKSRPAKKYDVVYIGLALALKNGVAGRLDKHTKDRLKEEWTHFSVYEVWDNITKEQVEELEGLFRQIYRTDTMANKLNFQRGYKKLNKIKEKNFSKW